MTHDSLDHGGLLNQRNEAQPPTAAWIRPHVHAKRPLHQLGPLVSTRP
jgi:hypothetical protein